MHVILTNSIPIRDAFIEISELHPHATAGETYQKGSTILAYRNILQPEIIEEAVKDFQAEKIWIVSPSRIVSTDMRLGDVVMPNVFLRYDHEIDEVAFDGKNRDEFLHDPLFIHHFQEQSDIDFETFGLSIGGICVTKLDGMDGAEREQIEFAYSADCIDEVCFPLVEAAARIDRKEDVFPVLLIVGSESSEEDQFLLAKNCPPVIAYLQSALDGGKNSDDSEEIDAEIIV